MPRGPSAGPTRTGGLRTDESARSTVGPDLDTIRLLTDDRVADFSRSEALTGAAIAHEGVEAATRVRILRSSDPDGNRVVLTD